MLNLFAETVGADITDMEIDGLVANLAPQIWPNDVFTMVGEKLTEAEQEAKGRWVDAQAGRLGQEYRAKQLMLAMLRKAG